MSRLSGLDSDNGVFTSQNKLPRLAVPRMAGRQTTFAGEDVRESVGGCWPRRAIEARRGPRPARSHAVGADAKPARSHAVGADAKRRAACVRLLVNDDGRRKYFVDHDQQAGTAKLVNDDVGGSASSITTGNAGDANRCSRPLRRQAQVLVAGTGAASTFAAAAPARTGAGRGHWRGLDGRASANTSNKNAVLSPRRMLSAGMPCAAWRGGRVRFVR